MEEELDDERELEDDELDEDESEAALEGLLGKRALGDEGNALEGATAWLDTLLGAMELALGADEELLDKIRPDDEALDGAKLEAAETSPVESELLTLAAAMGDDGLETAFRLEDIEASPLASELLGAGLEDREGTTLERLDAADRIDASDASPLESNWLTLAETIELDIGLLGMLDREALDAETLEGEALTSETLEGERGETEAGDMEAADTEDGEAGRSDDGDTEDGNADWLTAATLDALEGDARDGKLADKDETELLENDPAPTQHARETTKSGSVPRGPG